MKGDEMGGVCSVREIDGKYELLVGKCEKRDYSGEGGKGAYGTIIL
jgi:hypothetical protein